MNFHPGHVSECDRGSEQKLTDYAQLINVYPEARRQFKRCIRQLLHVHGSRLETFKSSGWIWYELSLEPSL